MRKCSACCRITDSSRLENPAIICILRNISQIQKEENLSRSGRIQMNTDNPNKKRETLTFIIILAAGAALAMCTHFFPSSEAAYIICPWLYVPCFLYVSRNMTRKIHLVLWSVFWCGSFMVRYWGIMAPFSPTVSLVLQFVSAAVFSLPYWLDRLLCRKDCGVAALLIFPFACASLDYLMELLGLGSLFSLAQTQFDNKLLLQIAAVLGCRGIVLVLTMWASFIVHYRKNLKAILICLAGLLVILLCGLARINIHTPVIEAADKVTIGWSGEPVVDDSFFYEGDGSDIDTGLDCLDRALSEAEQKGVELLCFPEESFYVDKEHLEEFIASAQELAVKYGISILLPVESDDPEDEEAMGLNQCLFIDSRGELQDAYNKTMLIPIGESPYYVQGTGELPDIETRIGAHDLKLSYAICFDGDFASYIRTIPDDTDLFIDVSWDWDEVDELHYRIIGLRAVENGLTVVKPTISGYSTVTDYLGNIRSITHSDDTGYPGVNLVELPLAKCGTIYHKFGNLIDAIYLVGLAVFILITVIGRRKGKYGTDS